MSSIIRVATTQYRTSNDVQHNLDTLLGLIKQAAEGGAQLLVTPEFGNHTSFYQDKSHAWEVAIDLDGDYLKAVQESARTHAIHVVFNATRRGEVAPDAYITNFLVGPDGELIGFSDKQVLMGGEAENLSGAVDSARVYETAIGRIGMMSCLDGVPPETARNLALLGAQIITNSHNSCALDEPYMHIPVRAAENAVWVIAAGKVGPICVDEMIGPLVEKFGITEHSITALGENPILNTVGEAIARLPCLEAGIIFADIDPRVADNKSWSDGDLFKDRRPDLYQAVGKPPQAYASNTSEPFDGAIVRVNSNRPFEINTERALDLVADAAQNGARLIVLPELFAFDLERLSTNPREVLQQSRLLERAVLNQCRQSGVYVALSLLTEEPSLYHSGILISDQGERIACYHQTHLPQSYKHWCQPGNSLPVWDTPLGRIGFMLGYDALFPEVATVLARQGAEIIVHPTQWQFEWEPKYILPERAAENRVSILSAARADSRVKRGGMICAMSASLPLGARDLNPIWPLESPADRESHIQCRIDPARSRNKDLLGFDLQADRRPELYKNLLIQI